MNRLKGDDLKVSAFMVVKMVLSRQEPPYMKNEVLLLMFLNGFLKIVFSVTSVHLFVLMPVSDLSCLMKRNERMPDGYGYA